MGMTLGRTEAPAWVVSSGDGGDDARSTSGRRGGKKG